MSNPSSFHLEYGQGMVLGYICTSRFCTLVGTEVLDSLFALIVPVWVEGAVLEFFGVEERFAKFTTNVHSSFLQGFQRGHDQGISI